jgi:hypothetical protein
MHGPINVKSPNNISKWQMGFNSAFKWLTVFPYLPLHWHYTLLGIDADNGRHLIGCT